MKQCMMVDHHIPEHGNNFIVNWFLGNQCNFRCSYCCDQLNSGNKKWVPFPTIRTMVEKVFAVQSPRVNGDIVFEFTGGEVTLFDDLPEVLSLIKHCGGKTSIISNGSRELDYWKKIKPMLHYCYLSFHAENTDERHFRQVIELLSDTVSVYALIMMHPSAFDKCVAFGRLLARENNTVFVNFHPLMRNLADDYRLIGYTERQLSMLQELALESEQRKVAFARNPLRGDMVNYYSDGSTSHLSPEQFISLQLNRWNGWICWAGCQQMVITQEGDAFRAWCTQDWLGNVYNDNINIPTVPTICMQDICHCNLDIMVRKQKIILFDREHVTEALEKESLR